MDLGVSSRQLDAARRGFSFRHDGPLDMRMDPDSGLSAADLVNTLPLEELTRIFFEYGEERHSRRIARRLVAERERTPFTTTLQLAEIVAAEMPRSKHDSGRIHPATRVFQALRIAVNDELGMLDRGLNAAFSVLAPGGRLAVISFHSLEDRIVKRRFADWSSGCVCPREFPECRCGVVPQARLLTRKVQVASEAEVNENPRARSARLRVIEKMEKLSTAAPADRPETRAA
jgi:16S rRNA (cytosine1402-N4)-methyltransferase